MTNQSCFTVGQLTGVVAEIAAERQRQISVEGYDPEHDDHVYGGHHAGELVLGAASYCMSASAAVNPLLTAQARHREYAERLWPWHQNWAPKPKGARRDLIRAAALIVAEIERLDRLDNVKSGEVTHD